MRQEKLISSFAFELSGFSPKAVVMTRWLSFWIKEHDCSHWKKVPQKREVTLHCQEKMFLPDKQKGICGQTSMEKFKLENNNFGTFCACSRKLKCFFFYNLFLPHWGRNLCTKLLGFFVFWKALVKDSTSKVSTLSIFSLNLIFIVFIVAIIPLKASGQLLQWYLFKNSV